MSQHSTRRDFLKQSAAAAGAVWWVGTQSAYADSSSPMERLNFACIGTDGKGSSDTDDAGRNGNIVALCDIDDSRIEKKARRYKDAKVFSDYRQMLVSMGDKIDAVTVSTPDHSHAPASVMAMKLGKHCFCQKPLTWSMHEARVMRETAKQHKVATQMGNQGTADNTLRECVDLIRAGKLGDIQEVHVWTNRPIWPQGEGRPAGSDEIPSTLHWDLFLGPAPERPYVKNAYHPFAWRGWLDFGTGALGDMACHTMNMPVMALDLFDAQSVEVVETTGIVNNETYPKYTVLKYNFGKRGQWPETAMHWYDGGKLPPFSLPNGEKLNQSGAIVVGSELTLYSAHDYGGKYTLLKTGTTEVVPTDSIQYEQKLPKSPGHFQEFAAACRGGEPAMSNFDYAGRLTETVLLGNVALRADQKVEWDAEKFAAKNLPDGGKQYLQRDYREGWTL